MEVRMNINELIAEMTLEEKATVLTGAASMTTAVIERLGIESIHMADGPHGVRMDAEKNCTLFPNLCCVAASWDKEMAHQLGEALAEECIHQGISLLLGPGINLKRHILCGRNFEYLSEDPVLAGELAAMYIKGLQEHGVGASLKHFALNNQEEAREKISVEIDERTLRELYLKGFELAVKKANPASVMCAYNKLHSIWCSENRFLLTDVLKKEWGYEGFVVSDWHAVHDTCRAIKAGLDLRMPRYPQMAEEVVAGVGDGSLEETDVDEAVRRVLRFVGDQTFPDREARDRYDREWQHHKAKEIASSGIVLLKNQNQILPLTPQKYRKLAVIGEFAKSPLVCGQGSAEVNAAPEWIDSPLEELTRQLEGVEIIYKEYFKKREYSATMLWPKFKEFRPFIREMDAVIFFIGSMESEDTEYLDRRDAHFNPNYEMFIREACKQGKRVIVVIQSGSAMLLGDWHQDVDAIVQMWLGGEGAGGAIAEVLTGKVNPSGRLPETFPRRMRSDLEYPGDGRKIVYHERHEVGYRYYDRHPEEVIYPFGHGLSFTQFVYEDLVVQAENDILRIFCKVRNAGDCDGAEVVQLYVGMTESDVSRPVKELKAFEKVFVRKGASEIVEIQLPIKELAYYNTCLHQWVVETGRYEVLIGASSMDIRLHEDVFIDGNVPYTQKQQGRSVIG